MDLGVVGGVAGQRCTFGQGDIGDAGVVGGVVSGGESLV